MKTAILTMARNEDHYIKEFVDYNFALGIDDIIVFANDWTCTVPIEQLEQPNHNIIFKEAHGSGIQRQLLNFMLREIAPKYDWTLFIDIDEFIVMKNGMSLQQYLEKMNNYKAIYFNWRMYGDNGILKADGDYSVLKRFTKCAQNLIPFGKFAINRKHINEIYFQDPHILRSTKTGQLFMEQVDSNGKIIETQTNTTEPNQIQQIEIAHFRNKSYQECLDRKFKNQSAFYGNKKYDDRKFFDEEYTLYNQNEITLQVNWPK